MKSTLHRLWEFILLLVSVIMIPLYKVRNGGSQSRHSTASGASSQDHSLGLDHSISDGKNFFIFFILFKFDVDSIGISSVWGENDQL